MRPFRPALLPALALAALGALSIGCGDDSSSGAADADVLSETTATPDATPEVTDAGPATDHDVATDDTPPPECAEGEWTCSDDATRLTRCDDGAWVETACVADEGRLCEEGACVEPWRWGAPEWSTCPDEPLGTPESLVAKAAYYDEIAERLHIHPDLGFILSVRLPADGSVDEATATWADVAQWHSGENDGLWSGLYLASQAFRYAVTGSEEALAIIRLLLKGEVDRMAITGVPGVFTRQLIPPGIPGLECPTDDDSYTTDLEKDDNRWVRVGDEGCVHVVDRDTLEWTVTDHCGLDDFAGYCWLDNVSQDEYAGHMLALTALVTLVDVPDVRDTAADLIEQVGEHLVVNELTFVDWDGRVTEHGKLYPTSFAGTPGFLASEALGFVKMAAEVSGRADLADFYETCLLQTTSVGRCMAWPLEVGAPYAEEYLPIMALYVGDEGCKSNFNNFSMVMTYLFDLLWFEHEPDLHRHIQGVLDTGVMRADSPRALIGQGNAWYNFMWAALKQLGPDSDGPAHDAVHDALCSLRQFAASQHQTAKDPGADYPHYCDGRLGGSQTEHPIPVAERCVSTFLWWSSPYNRSACVEDPNSIRQPGDYLLAYWMGRYFGFIPDDI